MLLAKAIEDPGKVRDAPVSYPRDRRRRVQLTGRAAPIFKGISDKPPISSAQYVLALALDLVAKEAQFNRFFGALAGRFGPHRSVCSAN